MRFKTSVKNINPFSSRLYLFVLEVTQFNIQEIELTASLSSLGKLAWVRLDDDNVRFTVIPETGTQVWA